MSPFRRGARIIFGGRRGRSGGVCFEWCSWSTDCCILVECEELSVLDDCELCSCELAQLESIVFIVVRGVRGKQAYICATGNLILNKLNDHGIMKTYRRMGLLRNIQAAK